MNRMASCVFYVLIIMFKILVSHELKQPTCLPEKSSWRDKNDPAVCSDSNTPMLRPVLSINGVQVPKNRTTSIAYNTVQYQPSQDDVKQTLVCSVSEGFNCTFDLTNIFYKPKVTVDRKSQDEFLCTVSANPLTTIVWTSHPSYMIHHTDKGNTKILSPKSILNVVNPSEIIEGTTFTCSMTNTMGSDNVTLLYRGNISIENDDDDDEHISYEISTTKKWFFSTKSTDNSVYTTVPWTVGKSENISEKQIPLLMILVIIGCILCLLILFIIVLYKQTHRNVDTDAKNNENPEPIYAELNITTGNQTNITDNSVSEINTAGPSVTANHYEYLPEINSNVTETKQDDESIEPCEMLENSEYQSQEKGDLHDLLEQCPEETPSYFVLEKDEDDICFIYEDINDESNVESKDDQKEEEKNIYAEIGLANMGKDFKSHENEIYESIDAVFKTEF